MYEVGYLAGATLSLLDDAKLVKHNLSWDENKEEKNSSSNKAQDNQ